MIKNEYAKKWHSDNKEYFRNYLKEKIVCEVCNCSLSRGSMGLHRNTKKHIKMTEKAQIEKAQTENKLIVDKPIVDNSNNKQIGEHLCVVDKSIIDEYIKMRTDNIIKQKLQDEYDVYIKQKIDVVLNNNLHADG